jgi:outer membrane protein OmpA-like peptidoglycan-associated protein
MAESFDGAWRGRGLRLRLAQNGPVVSGCYDEAGVLSGTVTGNLLKATGIDRGDQVLSLFILAVTSDGLLRGVSSTNGAPFRLIEAPPAAAEAVGCDDPPPPALGCGAIVHGIQFELDSADLRPGSDRILESLSEGLKDEDSASVTIEGHTSSEGTEIYNQTLSERRAAAVRADLIRRGVPASRLHAAGAGESRPLAANDDESGRAINRRVEVHCK